MVQKNDVVIIISKSGDSPEIKVLVPFIKNFGNTLIAIAGNMQGYLAQHADIVINSTVQQEACPNNLAPTSSALAQMAMGDALAIALMETRGFGSQDFARYHPGGALGKKLYLRVQDMVHPHENPQVHPEASLRTILVEITGKRLGAAAVLNDEKKVTGIITDGDIRRMLEKYDNPGSIKAADIMGHHPKTIHKNALAAEALEIMKKHNINQLPVLEEDDTYYGILHLQDLMREGII